MGWDGGGGGGGGGGPVTPRTPPGSGHGACGKGGLRSANTKHLETVAMLLITPNIGT